MNLCCSSVEKVLSDGNLLTEILIRLPLRSIRASRCVCKRWFSVTSDPYFKTLIPTPVSSSGLLLKLMDHNYSVTYDFVPFADNAVDQDHLKPPRIYPDLNEFFLVLQSCNGLMLYEIIVRPENMSEKTRKYYVCNPTTEEAAMLPDYYPGSYRNYRRPFSVTLAFNPRRSPRYRVICVRSVSSDDTCCHMNIYSSETTATWKSVSKPCPIAFVQMFECWGWRASGVYWNEAIHWICEWKSLVYFKIEEECFHQFIGNGRPGFFNFLLKPKLFESRNRLLLFETLSSGWEICIREMDINYSGWRTMYSIDLRRSLGLSLVDTSMISGYRDPVVLCVVTGEREDDLFFVMATHGNKLMRYNIVSKTWEELRYEHRPYHRVQVAFPFIESYCEC